MHEAIGKIRYSESGWVVLDVPQSIVTYYNWWIRKLTWKKATKPLHGAHVTIVAGKYVDPNIINHKNWKKHDGKKVQFKYNGIIKAEDSYFWLQIYCPFLEELRKELDLDAKPWHDFHLTIGYVNKD